MYPSMFLAMPIRMFLPSTNIEKCWKNIKLAQSWHYNFKLGLQDLKIWVLIYVAVNCYNNNYYFFTQN